MATKPSILILFTILLMTLILTISSATKLRHVRRPCKRITVYYHDIIYTGNNSANSTSAIIDHPAWANKTSLYGVTFFGDLVAFDGPLTEGKNIKSPPVGRAQGLYLYTSNKSGFSAWHAFSLVFNSTKHKGSLNVAGLNVISNRTRDLPVVGGTGDFFMHRGIVTFTTDGVEGITFYRLHMDIKLYECWRMDA